MADSVAFDKAAETLEERTDLDRLEARGTIRILLKQVGFDAKAVTAKDLRIVVEKLLSNELVNRGVSDPATAVSAIVTVLGRVSDDALGDSPEDVFARLGGQS